MLQFPSLKIEGGLLGGDLVEQIFSGEVEGQKAKDFGFASESEFRDRLAFLWNRTRELWEDFQNRLERLSPEDPATSLTRERFVIPLLELLNYNPTFQREPVEIDGRRFHLSHRADPDKDAPFVHIVGIRQSLDRRQEAGIARMAPHAYVQEFLNKTDHLWAIVTNGAIVRLLRDSQYMARQAYIEFNLQEMLANELFADFQIFVRLVHRTRLPKTVADAPECLLERYYRLTIEQGGRIRDRLRDGVEQAIKILGTALLQNPRNDELREKVRNGKLTPQKFYEQLLRIIYRLLFLFVAEERNLLTNNEIYRRYYSATRLRQLVDVKSAWTERHCDLWLGLQKTFLLLSNEHHANKMGITPLNGDLFRPSHTDDLNNAHVTNADFLKALWYLCKFKPNERSPFQRVNYAQLDVEELGSIYESLLDYHPMFKDEGGKLAFELVPAGLERKSTGSYYTPRELVGELIKSALEPVLQERLKETKTPEEKEQAILSIKVLDPACGSGHFLLAAARRLAKELAKIRTGDEEPAPSEYRKALRDVVRNCIYGVDKNPLAVELCKVALWIESHAEGKPLAFLDHKIKCGDSLVGVLDLSVLKDGIPDEAYEPVAGDDKSVARQLWQSNRSAVKGQLALDFGSELQNLAQLIHQLTATPDDTTEQVRQKGERYHQIQQDPTWWRNQTLCHLWTAAFFAPLTEDNLSRIPKTADLHTLLRTKSGTSLRSDIIGFAWELAQRHRFFHWALEFPEVFAEGGFDVILSNPPFMGGLKISGTLGDKYRNYLTKLYEPFKGTADLCAAFYRRSFILLKPNGMLGMVATNTISQGDTRESGLAVIVQNGGTITFARRFIKWPGVANVEVNLITIHKGKWHGDRILDGQPVDFISSRLDSDPEAEPKRLKQNEGKAFQGDILRGVGFIVDRYKAEQLIAKDPHNADCLFPYLAGEDLNSHPEQKPSRYVICFHDWDLEQAQQYPDLLSIVEERVKPEREKLTRPSDRKDREHWWLFCAYRRELRRAIANLKRVLVRALTSEMHMMTFVPRGWIYSHAIGVFAFDDDYHFALLQSNVHEVWLRRQSSTLRTDVRYTPTDCFDTFPFPPAEYKAKNLERLLQQPCFARAAQIGAEYHEHRRKIMLARQIGLTQTYNLFHNPNCNDADIVRLRELHAEMDKSILACYDWNDLDLQHNFYQNERGQTRFTVSPSARRELLRRLLELNLQIAYQEMH